MRLETPDSLHVEWLEITTDEVYVKFRIPIQGVSIFKYKRELVK